MSDPKHRPYFAIVVDDNDICVDCEHLVRNHYGPSRCTQDFPALFNDDDYAVQCEKHTAIKEAA